MKNVVVIGAGVIGVSTAYYLRQHGLDVTVVDREPSPAGGASYGNGGYLQTAVTDPWNAPGVLRLFAKAWLNGLTGRGDRSAFLTRTGALPGLTAWGLRFLRHANVETYLTHTVKNMHLAQYSVRLIKDIAERESLTFAQSNNGALIIFKDEASLTGYADVAEQVAEHGAQYEVLDRNALLEKEPSLTGIGDELVGAVFFPSDAAGNSREYCEQLVEIMRGQGVDFSFASAVSGIAASGNAIEVRTGDQSYIADAVVIAAGNNAKRLAGPLGVKLPIAPAKGFSLSAPMGDWDNPPSRPIIDMSQHAGVNPLGTTLRVAGAAEFAGMKPGINEVRMEYLVGLARGLFPDFAETIKPENCDPWGGHRPLSVDGLPMIGETDVKGVFVNAGHGGMGWTQSAGSGKALADLIVGAKPEIDLSHFNVSRFN